MSEISSRVAGAFTGYNDGAIFRLTNGQVWQQRRYKYKYRYKYRPKVRIYRDGPRRLAEFDCMDEPVEVVQVSILDEGVIVSDFEGFSDASRFEFQGGTIWEQAEYRYSYHYAYRPSAMVVEGVNGTVLYVDGMAECVRVRRV
jgi:hypothetical protein